MVLRCGQKPSGEEVSVSLVYTLGLWTDQTTTLAKKNKIMSTIAKVRGIREFTQAGACSLPKLFSLFFPSYVGFVPVSNLLAIFVDASFHRRFGS